MDATTAYTWADLANRMKDDELLDIVPVLTKQNPIFEMGYFEPCNQVTQHKIVRQAALVDGSLRQLNDGIDAESDYVESVVEHIEMREARNLVDVALAALSQNPAKFRAQRDNAFTEGLTQKFVSDLIYGDRGDDHRQIKGWAARRNSTGNANVIDNGDSGASDDSSVYVVQFGPGRSTLIYPTSHTKAGIERLDRGIQDATGNNSKIMLAYETWHKVHMGFAEYDPRCLQRICNIDSVYGEANDLDPDAIIEAIMKLPDLGAGNTVILMNRTIYTQLLKQAKDKMNVEYLRENPYGPEMNITFNGIRVRLLEGITNTEDSVTA